jgi:ABC-type cobalamin/Fe3+-siderophores transport system ATPase subunit
LEAFAIKLIRNWLIDEKTNHLDLKNHNTILRVLVKFLAYFG